MPAKNAADSPLRYPGSKAALIPYIERLIAANNLNQRTIIEPYAGSAIVSLHLLREQKINRAILIERDPLVYAFWESVFNHTDELIERIHSTPINLDTWNAFQCYRSLDGIIDQDIVSLGFAGLFFNRTNFSGILKAGPLGGYTQTSKYPIDCRFKKDKIISRINKIAALRDRVTVEFGDAIFLLRGKLRRQIDIEHPFLYIDPPYYAKGKQLYRYWFSPEQHGQLANYLHQVNTDWLVSYDNHKAIESLYSGPNHAKTIHFRPISFDYTVYKSRSNAKELLISNLQLPPETILLQQANNQ